MTREEVKKLLPIFKAFSEGETIQHLDIINDKWEDVDEFVYHGSVKSYRIKSDSQSKAKYRPFANAEECWQEMLKHQPFGWIKSKEDGSRSLITLIISEEDIDINCIGGFNSDKIMKRFTFADGAVFGILEEE